jgi:hypothetical protein
MPAINHYPGCRNRTQRDNEMLLKSLASMDDPLSMVVTEEGIMMWCQHTRAYWFIDRVGMDKRGVALVIVMPYEDALQALMMMRVAHAVVDPAKYKKAAVQYAEGLLKR